MKKRLALLLACTMALSLTACGGGKAADPTTTAAPATTAATEAAGEESKEAADTTAAEAAGGDMDALIEAAKAEGELTVYGSCEEAVKSGFAEHECVYGCVGAGSCVAACTFGALSIVDGNVQVDKEKCNGCGACANACVQNLIHMVPSDASERGMVRLSTALTRATSSRGLNGFTT